MLILEKMTDLQKAVYEQLGCSNIEDFKGELKNVLACSCGADGGFNGFIYYSETCEFFDKNEKLIFEKLLDDRCSIGYNSLTEMLKSFNCFKNIDTWLIERFLINPQDEENEEQTTLKNGLAWYCLEETAYSLEEELN